MAKDVSTLQYIDPKLIERNPENPRLIFREDDLNQLLDSIREVGIQVPLSMYREGRRYKLIDGERRWRCALKLNLEDVPAHVQTRPGRLENILMMFNIHNVRTDWDLMPMALKLLDIQKLLKAEGKPSKAKDLAGITGVPLPTINRALELVQLPKKYQTLLLKEAEKPKEEQTVTPDLFIEVNKSKRVLQKYVPSVFEEISDEEFVDAMVDKYRAGIIESVVAVRDVSRMARAERAGEDAEAVAPFIVDLVRDPDLTIADAFEATVKTAYDIRDLQTRTAALIDRLTGIKARNLTEELKENLGQLRKIIDRLLGDR